MTHVVLIADSRYPIAEPFAGGLQSMTWHLVHGLRDRGVEVSVFAGPGSDPRLGARLLDVAPVELSEAARNDVSMQPLEWMQQHHAYLRLMLELARRHDVDLVHNNSLHYMPVAMAETLGVPMVTTLHTPPTPWLEPVVAASAAGRTHYVAVSAHTARQWSHAAEATVVHNGIDTRRWPYGAGGPDLVWFGRMVPEKSPHLAIEVAERAGRRLLLAGPRPDPVYWHEHVHPRLGDRIVYLGHLGQAELAAVVGRCAAALVTPTWDEPYGLTAAEALCCGTPVVGFGRGGLTEFVPASCSRLVEPGDVETAADAIDDMAAIPRHEVRDWARQRCSIDLMVDRYLALYEGLTKARAA